MSNNKFDYFVSKMSIVYYNLVYFRMVYRLFFVICVYEVIERKLYY